MPVSISINYQTPVSHQFDCYSFINTALRLKQLVQGSIDFTFVNDSYMTTLHETYLNDSSETDIITFNLDSLLNPIGDIYICINEAERNSDLYNTNLDHELQYLILHGILHLIGYTDSTDFEKTYMLDEQTRLLTLIQGL